MLLTIIAVLVVLWLLGLLANVGGFIHLLLVAAVIVLIYDIIVGRRGRSSL